MSTTVKLKRGSGSDPSASDMVVGEPVIRTDTAELFFKKDDGSVAKVSGGGGGPDFKYLALRNAANNGSASYPGNDFTLVTSGTTTAISPAAANTLLVSYGGVIQKPNSGTSTSGITGFIVDGSRFKTATNLAAAPDFILYQESGGIGEPSDDTVTNAKVTSNAAIAGTKISPDFGSQNIVTSGIATINGGDVIIQSSAQPSVHLRDSGDNPDYILRNNDGTFIIYDSTNTTTRLQVNTDGHVDVTGNLDVGAGIDVTGNITVSGTVDGVDIAALNTTVGTKLPLAGGTLTGNVIHNDNVKALFGTDSDLHIFHSGTTATIDNNTGNLNFETTGNEVHSVQSEFQVKVKSGTEDGLKVITDGAVELYWNNAKRLDTYEYGVNVTGNITTTSHVYWGDNGEAIFGAGSDLKIYHDGSHSYISDLGTGDLVIKAQNFNIHAANGTSMAYGVQGAQFELYHGGSKKLFTSTNGAVVESGTANFEIYSSTDDADATLSLIGKTPSGGVGQAGIVRIIGESTSTSNGSSSMHLQTRTSGNAVTTALTINASQQVWIGSTAQYGANAKNLADKGVAITAAGENALKVLDSTSYASDVGGAILMGGNYRSSADTQPFVELKSFKENGTDTDYAYGFRIGTTPNGGSITERFRIHSEGYITKPSQPNFVTHGTNSDGSANSENFLNIGNTYHNIGNDYNTSNGRFTCPVTGIYFFYCSWTSDNTTSSPVIYFFVNGSQSQSGALNYNSQYAGTYMGQCFSLSANDYVQCSMRDWNNSTPSPWQTWWGGYLLQ